MIRMISNSATHATTDTVAIVRAEQKFNPSCASRRFQCIPVQPRETAVLFFTLELSGNARL